MTFEKTEVGTRVFAVLDANEKEVRLLGFGTYVGSAVSPVPVGMAAALWSTWEDFDRDAIAEGCKDPVAVRPTNPKIVLDDGVVVWGSECWWGPAERYEAFRQGRPETRVSIAEVRQQACAWKAV